MRSQPFDIYDDALYDCADGVARLGSEVAQRLPADGVVPLECLGRVLYGWERTDGDETYREYVTADGAFVSDGRLRDRDTAARLVFETALTPERLEAHLTESTVGDDLDPEALSERREWVARVASGIVDMAAQRSFFDRYDESIPLGVDRRYDVRVGEEVRTQVARALGRSVEPAAASFVAERLPETVVARVELVSVPDSPGDDSGETAGTRRPSEKGDAAPRRDGGEGAESDSDDADPRDPGDADDSGAESDSRDGGGSGGDDPSGALDEDVWLSPPPELTFEDVGGMDDLKGELREKVIHPLREPEVYERYGLGTANGVLLYGPPGTGKTYVTKALAGELDYAFVDLNPADVVSKWVGEAAKQVGRVFDLARENQPCLIFIDELDALAPRRDGGTHSTQSERQMLNQLLIELAEVQGERIVVVAATNKYEEVDDAIRRSGRFDERINVPPPDGQSRLEILFTHLDGRPFDADSLDRDHVVERTRGYTASDMELVATNAARKALERERTSSERGGIRQSDVEAAIAETEPSLASADLETWRWATNQ